MQAAPDTFFYQEGNLGQRPGHGWYVTINDVCRQVRKCVIEWQMYLETHYARRLYMNQYTCKQAINYHNRCTESFPV